MKAEEATDFAEIQLSHIRAFRDAYPTGRVSQGLVAIPRDSATDAQRAKYAAYAQARMPRTASPVGPRQAAVRPGPAGLLERDRGSAVRARRVREVAEAAFALPFTFAHEDYVQIPTDMTEKLGPALGWRPR